MVDEYNTLLRIDGWEIYRAKEISGRPVFSFRHAIASLEPHLSEAERVAGRLTGAYIAQQIQRLRTTSERDPEAAIGAAKEFLETVCKAILSERGILPDGHPDFPALVKITAKAVVIAPQNHVAKDDARKIVAGLLSGLGAVVQQIAEIRNQFGTGHGKAPNYIGLETRHSRLAIASASALAAFLYDCHEAYSPEERR